MSATAQYRVGQHGEVLVERLEAMTARTLETVYQDGICCNI